jgi:hypothetical protein
MNRHAANAVRPAADISGALEALTAEVSRMAG